MFSKAFWRSCGLFLSVGSPPPNDVILSLFPFLKLYVIDFFFGFHHEDVGLSFVVCGLASTDFCISAATLCKESCSSPNPSSYLFILEPYPREQLRKLIRHTRFFKPYFFLLVCINQKAPLLICVFSYSFIVRIR